MKRAKTATAQLKVRLKEPLRAHLDRSAKQRGISLNAEMVNRLEQSFEWDRSFGEARKVMADAEVALRAGLETALRHHGFQPVTTDKGRIWLEPGMRLDKISRSIDAAALVRAIEPDLVAALVRGISVLHGEGK